MSVNKPTITDAKGKVTLASLAKMLVKLIDAVSNLMNIVTKLQTAVETITQRLDAITQLAANEVTSMVHAIDCDCATCIDAFLASLPVEAREKMLAMLDARVSVLELGPHHPANAPTPKARNANGTRNLAGPLDVSSYVKFINSLLEILHTNKANKVYNVRIAEAFENQGLEIGPRVYADTATNKAIKTYRNSQNPVITLKAIDAELTKRFKA